tara:strand:+ start:577 stop:696 length:120 start_codon:yes stop_codon:yes gene_type:complete
LFDCHPPLAYCQIDSLLNRIKKAEINNEGNQPKAVVMKN